MTDLQKLDYIFLPGDANKESFLSAYGEYELLYQLSRNYNQYRAFRFTSNLKANYYGKPYSYLRKDSILQP